MESRLDFHIQPQPDDSTCGATCLHAVYRFFGAERELSEIAVEVPQLDGGGTLGVLLGVHALRHGYQATLYTYNLEVFDPTWFGPVVVDLGERLRRQMELKRDNPRLLLSSNAYLDFLERGGKLVLEDLTAGLLRHYLKRGQPILTGLSATYLYRSPRESGPQQDDDDVGGLAMGHFVVLCGYDPEERSVLVADPLRPNPLSKEPLYKVSIDRLICAILLGIMTYDANMLIVSPREPRAGKSA